MDSNKIFKAFDQLNIMVVGDVMIDKYLNGAVTRISPEAPVPIVNLSSSENRLGGAANVALNVKALGATPYLFGMIGNDANESIFHNLLKKNALWENGILSSNERSTTSKTRVLANNQQMLRLDQEHTHDLSEEEEVQFLAKIKSFLTKQKIDAIIFQDYNKGVCTIGVIRTIINWAKEKNIKTIVDPKKENFWEYEGVDIFKPNLKEIKESSYLKNITSEKDSLETASRNLMRRTDIKNTIITLSEKGVFIDDGKSSNIIPTQVRKIADVCGAGDSVVSIAALGMAIGLELEDIGILSNLAGGQVCEKVGVVTIDKDQLKKEYEQLLQGTFS